MSTTEKPVIQKMGLSSAEAREAFTASEMSRIASWLEQGLPAEPVLLSEAGALAVLH